MRRSQNIEDESGILHSFESEIKQIDFKHFKSQFSPIETEDLCSQIEVLAHMPKFFNDSDCVEIGKVVSIDEVKDIVFKMPKDKSLGSDGWTQELFQSFFEVLGEDLHKAVEESIIYGFIPGSLNATFFALIPKVNKLGNFHDFRPIALCNFVYKVI